MGPLYITCNDSAVLSKGDGSSMVLNLKDDAQLKQACDTILQQTLTQKGNRDWVAGLLTLLREVRDVDEPTFFSERFQRNLWDSEQVTSTGMGQVDISKVAQDTSVIEQLWRLKTDSRALKELNKSCLSPKPGTL